MQAIIDKDNGRHFGSSPADAGPLATDLSPRPHPRCHRQGHAQGRRLAARHQPAILRPDLDLRRPLHRPARRLRLHRRPPLPRRHARRRPEVPLDHPSNVLPALPNADDLAITQTYLDLYLTTPKSQQDTHWIEPTRAQVDSVVNLKTLTPTDPRLPWWWCDALFMAPPVYARMFAVTGDSKYIAYLDENFKATSDLLYNKQEHLYARDANYLTRTEPNGKLMFWSPRQWLGHGRHRPLL